jgi:hypothetical protein
MVGGFQGMPPVRLTQLNRVVNLALAVTLTIAGCSLAVAVAAGIIERKRPFALLRLAGMHLAELQRTALLEAAAPLLLIASASALLGLGTSAVIDQGLFERRQYREHPPRDEYRLPDAPTRSL